MTAPGAPPPGSPVIPGGPGRGPEFQFSVAGIAPPAPAYIGPADRLVITVVNLVAANNVVTIGGRQLLPNGVVSAFNFNLKPQPLGTSVVTLLSFGETMLLNIQAVATQAERGQCYVSISLQRGDLSGTNAEGTLAAGYSTGLQPLSWPGSPIEPFVSGFGWRHAYLATTPAAGADFADVVPALTARRYLSAAIVFATDATVGNRTVEFQLLGTGGVLVFQSRVEFAQAPSTTVTYSLSPSGQGGVGAAGSATVQHILPPDPLLWGGSAQLLSLTQGKGPGDQWSNIRIMAEDWVFV